MNASVERVARFVDDLLSGARPRRFPADVDEASVLRAAAEMRAARPGADLPSPRFVAGLERRLALQAEGRARLSRRRLLARASAVAAAVVAGVGLDRLLVRQPERELGTSDSLALQPGGRWQAVVAAGKVPAGTAVRFSAGAIEGFVINRAGTVEALSAVCTHLGCILRFNQAAATLDCPCHGASFALDGSPLNREYLVSLPRLVSRTHEGMIEVRVV